MNFSNRKDLQKHKNTYFFITEPLGLYISCFDCQMIKYNPTHIMITPPNMDNDDAILPDINDDR